MVVIVVAIITVVLIVLISVIGGRYGTGRGVDNDHRPSLISKIIDWMN